MPPAPIALFPLPQDRIKTRARNKDKHPGAPDMPKPRRRPSEVDKSNKQAEEKDRQEENERTELIRAVAEIEDRHRREDEHREAIRRATLNGTAIKSPEHGASPSPEPQASQESVPPRVSKKTSQNRAPNPKSRSNDNADRTRHHDPKKNLARDKEPMRSSEEKRKRKRVTTDDEDEVDNDYPDSEDERASNESRERARRKRNKKTASRDDIERARNTRAISGTPAVNQEHDIDVHDVTQKGKKAAKARKDDTGLIPGWDKKKPHAQSFAEDSDAEDNGGIVEYGGFIRDDETDEVERIAAMKKLAKKAKDDNIVVIKPNPIAPKTLVEARQGDKKWATRHLPQEARADWETVFAPLLHKKGGTSLKPWSFPSIAEIQAVADKVYGDGKYKILDGDAFSGLAIIRAQAWRRGFVDAAETAVKSFISKHSKELETKEDIAEYIDYYLSKTKDGATRVYQWKIVNKDGKKKGLLASGLICQTLGIAHMGKVAEPAVDFIEEKPSGALVSHVLEQWRDGLFIKTKKEFSAENYDNREDRIPVITQERRKVVKKVITHRTTLLFDAIRQFSNAHWDSIIDTAREYAPKKTKTKAMKQPKSHGNDVIIIEDESCNLPSFVLVEDSDASDAD
ncbi:hypothetical protein M378DRAFT_15863 [Amanita muscaria Koide BX008]|uniref:Uncharacterized protein n=1 Tax=Amanita muscaria (strain Koide BX008) TaxID=946122 RepID=A0A0C2S5L3_AMAMK|nr:hypothetical protein M378DRAFT_15863 [Amanita muscaria Koide BX008]